MILMGLNRKTSRACTSKRNHRGVAIVLVLGLLAAVLALSYAMIRSQATIETTQRNDGFRDAARQAARAGLTAGLRTMHDAAWAGVDAPLTGTFDANTTYLVTYATGDTALQTTDPNYAEWPYRVTVTCTSTATDPANPTVQATDSVQVVVQLVRRKLADQPSSWIAMQPYAVYQWGTGGGKEVDIEFPSRVAGPAFLQNKIDYLEDYPNDGDDKAFHGSIDEVAIFAFPLPQSMIQNLAKATMTIQQLVAIRGTNPVSWWKLDEAGGVQVAIDQLGSNPGRYDGAKAGASPEPSAGGKAAASFDGFNDHVDLGRVDVSGSAMTILGWFKVDSFNHTDGRIISKATGASTGEHYWMVSTYNSSGHNRLRFRLRTRGYTSNLIASSGDVPLNTWVFVAAVYDGTKMELYQDGVLVGSIAKSGSINTNATVRASLGNNPPASPRARLLRDLEAMRVAGDGDFRPFGGTITTPTRLTSAQDRSLLTSETNLTLTDTTAGSGAAPLAHPGNIVSYRLYPGGKQYYPPELASTISGVTLAPNAQTNPLGVFKRSRTLQVNSRVSIQGTLLTYDSGSNDIVQLRGTGVSLSPYTLPFVYGDNTIRQLPTILSGDDIEVYSGSDSTIRGMIMAWDDVECLSGTQSTRFDVQGLVAASELELQSRSEWDQSESWWKTRLHEFLNQLDGAKPMQRFPEWLKAEHALDYEPKITLKPDTTGVTYHWHDWSQPLFVAHPDDGGLRWDVIRWVDDP